MSDYNYTNNKFSGKDGLANGDNDKVIRGSDFETEFSNIETAIATKADLNSPSLTGTPLSPTAVAGTNTTQIATTAFVATSFAPLASPALTGTPTATTASFGTDDTQIATTAFVQDALAGAYPVGSIYINATDATNPATLLGFGTWTAFGAGKVMVGIDSGDTDFDTAEETGGSKTGTFDVTVPRDGWGSVQSGGELPEPTTDGRLITGSGRTESGENLESLAHANGDRTFTSDSGSIIQPYIVVYMWKRTA